MSLKKLFNNYATRFRGEYDEPMYLTAPPPPVKEAYVLRETQEEELFQMLKRRGTQILLHGAGGTGKTHMARKLFYRLAGEYKRLAWVECGTDIRSALLAAVRVPEQTLNGKVHFYQVIDQLAMEPKETILFVDDAKEVTDDDVLARITGLGITILLTSRCNSIPPYDSYEMNPLTVTECVDFFYRHYPYDHKQAKRGIVEQLVQLLDFNVMSVLLLARMIGKEKNLERYFRKLNGEHFGTYEHIRRLLQFSDLNDEQYRILQCFALMPNGETPADIMKCFGICDKDLTDLVQKGWLETNESQNTFILHDIIREYLVREDIPENIFSQLFLCVTQNEYLTQGDTEEQRRYKLESVKRAVGEANESYEGFWESCIWLGDAYCAQNKYGQALEYYQNALEVQKNLLGEDHPNTAESHNTIGSIYDDIGNYPKALEHYEKALAIRERVFGIDHPSTASSYNNIGVVCDNVGEYSQALQYYQKSLSIWENILGDNHPNTASAYNNIGVVYDNMGEHAYALEYCQKALEIRKQALGEKHSDTANSYNNIGVIYDQKGDCVKALEYYEKALKIQIQILGEAHPDTAGIYHNIGNVYSRQEEYSRALDNYKKALEIRRRILGENHPDTAGSYHNIGNVYNYMEDYSQALQYYEKALEIRKRILGEKHFRTANSYLNIGLVYAKSENYKKALEYGECARTIMEEKHSLDHSKLEYIREFLERVRAKLNE